MSTLDLPEATAHELQRHLTDGSLTSVGLAKACLSMIRRHNKAGLQLNSMLFVADDEDVLARAQQLDDERAAGRVRSPLHGIPITIKDTICAPSLKLPTTAGSWGLMDAVSAEDWPGIQQLDEAGLIILGKDNLSEFGQCKDFRTTPGWSAVGGQTRNPYAAEHPPVGSRLTDRRSPGGSSSGTGVSVAAGFAPLGVGHETNGSITNPSDRSSIYGMKPTARLVPMANVIKASDDIDSLGPMAKSPLDCANLLTALLQPAAREKLGPAGYSECFRGKEGLKGLKVGFVKPEEWRPNSELWGEHDHEVLAEIDAGMRASAEKFAAHGARVSRSIHLQSRDMSENIVIFMHEMKGCVDRHLSSCKSTPVHSLEDLIEWNKANPERGLPADYPMQDGLLLAQGGAMTDQESHERFWKWRNESIRTVTKAFQEQDLDIVVGPGEGSLPNLTCETGFPICAMPYGYLKKDGSPFGMFAVALGGREDLLFRLMSAWEDIMPKRKPPPALSS